MSETGGLEGLSALVRDCTVSGVGRRALLFRADMLPSGLSRPHHLRLARAALDPLTLADRARQHELPGGRWAISWRGEAPALVNKALAGLETLLRDSPLDAPGMPELIGMFELPKDGPNLLREAAAGTEPTTAEVEMLPLPARAARAPVPLDAAALAVLEQSLARADMARFARRRPICRVAPSGFQLAWEERFLAVAELVETIFPGRNAEADPWLFRRLTRLLDRRMLALLCAPSELRDAGAFSTTLNVSSILGPDFLRLDAALPSSLRGRAILNLLPVDVLSDPAAFAFARSFARARGFRLCLRSVTAALLPMLNLPSLEMDFVELRWSADLAGTDRDMLRPGQARWVLARADNAVAIDWGRSVGIGLFRNPAKVEIAG